MIRHLVTFTWKPGTTTDDIDAVETVLAGLPGRIPSIKAYRFARDLGLDDGNSEFAIIADFDDVAGYEAYRDDPYHQEVIRTRIRPLIAARSAIQIDLG